MGRLVVRVAKVANVALAAAVLAVVVGCTTAPRAGGSSPPAGASARVVLDTYLRALVAGDCDTAHTATAPSFSTADAMCGHVRVSAFSVPDDPATPGADELHYATTLTTKGSPDGTIEPGTTMWFYTLRRQGGEWRIVDAGSGP